jgi:hypothetical protein
MSERHKLESQFKQDFEFRKLHNAALITAVPQFDRQRDTVTLNDFLDKLQQVLFGPYQTAPNLVKLQFLETKMSPAAKLWFKGLNLPKEAQWNGTSIELHPNTNPTRTKNLLERNSPTLPPCQPIKRSSPANLLLVKAYGITMMALECGCTFQTTPLFVAPSSNATMMPPLPVTMPSLRLSARLNACITGQDSASM